MPSCLLSLDCLRVGVKNVDYSSTTVSLLKENELPTFFQIGSDALIYLLLLVHVSEYLQ